VVLGEIELADAGQEFASRPAWTPPLLAREHAEATR
jgi:hypothetical protein